MLSGVQVAVSKAPYIPPALGASFLQDRANPLASGAHIQPNAAVLHWPPLALPLNGILNQRHIFLWKHAH